MNTLVRMVVCVALALVGLVVFVVYAYMGKVGQGVSKGLMFFIFAWIACPSIDDMDACVAEARSELHLDE